MHDHDAALRILDELLARARAVRLDAVLEVFDVIERGAEPRERVGGADADAILSSLAKQVVTLQVPGSKVDFVSRAVVMYALSSSNGNVSAAARMLGIERKAMERKIARYRSGNGADDDD